MKPAFKSLLVLAAVLLPQLASAEARRDRVSAGGYFRIMTRPDFQGGGGRLGYWNLYGRLLNEGPFAALELRLDAMQANPGTNEVWAAIHGKLEGGSVANTDPNNGNLSLFRMSQLFVRAGNILFDSVTWQLGTLESYYGDLGLYDMRPATIFNDTVGLSARYQKGKLDLLVGAGDAGYAVRGLQYSTIFTAGGTARVTVNEHLQLGGGGQVGLEPSVPGNRFAPYVTPGLNYEDFHRREVVRRYVENNPNREDLFPRPQSTSNNSWKLIGYLGWGNIGPLRWSNAYASFSKRHPLNFYTENFGGRDYTIYIADQTDQRYSMIAGNEMMFTVIEDRLDAVWAVLAGQDLNLDNKIAAGEDNRRFFSTVLRGQLYLTETIHLLGESSVAQEISLNGNLFRQHHDSVFRNTGGRPDVRGLEFGDSDTRNTWQMKSGVVFNPKGRGVYNRPSLRLLYGLQYSSQQAAFGNGYVESLDQFNDFQSPELHWHHVVAIEAEAWF
ncbi:MAG: hypothetical protein ACK4N5_03010 [Myxococcales bacterium]